MAATRTLPWSPGTVVRHRSDGYRGVVAYVVREGDPRPPPGIPFAAVGDMVIQISRGTHRVTNIYDEWSAVPPIEQTAVERVRAVRHGWRPPDWYDDDATPQDIDTYEYALLRALLPPDVTDGWVDPPNSTTGMAMRAAQYVDECEDIIDAMAGDLR